MAWNADGTRRPDCLFEAGLWRQAVKPVCRCGHGSAFDPWGLWWLFERRGWDGHFRTAKRRFWCRVCAMRHGDKRRPERLETVSLTGAEMQFPRPPESERKRAVRRVRSWALLAHCADPCF